MRRRLLLLSLPLAWTTGLWAQRRGFRWFGRGEEAPLQGKTEAEKRIINVLNEAIRAGRTFSNVSVSDGRLLRVLAEGIRAKNVVEIGTSTGLSGLWLSMALEVTGGKLTTFELDSGRAATARRHFKEAGVDRLITLIEGDAHQNVTRLKEPIDLAFIDADKEGYLDYLKKLRPLVRSGGLIVAHNFSTAPDYARAVTTDPELETAFAGDGNDVGITLKKI